MEQVCQVGQRRELLGFQILHLARVQLRDRVCIMKLSVPAHRKIEDELRSWILLLPEIDFRQDRRYSPASPRFVPVVVIMLTTVLPLPR